MPRLQLLESDSTPRWFPLRGRTLIGRDVENDVVLADGAVSSHHALLFVRTDGTAFIRDMRSSNGTWVDGRRVGQCDIHDGSVIRLGNARLRFISLAADPAVPSAAAWEWDGSQDQEQDTDTFVRKGAAPGVESQLGLQRDLMALYELGDLLHASRTEDQLYRCVARLVERATGANRVSLVEWPGGEREPVLLLVWPDGSELNDGQPYSRTVTERVMGQGRTILVPDVAIQGDLRHAPSLPGCHARTVLCAPLRSQQRIFGIIFASHHEPTFQFAARQVRLITAVGLEAGIALENLRLMRHQERSFLDTTEALVSALDARDDYTAGHSRRVADMSMAIARCAELREHELQELRLGAMLHDIGKIGVDDECLRAPRRLTPSEHRRIQQHTVKGDRILEPLGSLERIRSIVRHHHERWDGTGYPDRLGNDAIPLAARIVAIADTIDAITSDRPYRQGRSLDVAVREVLRCSGTQFDPAMVGALVRSLRIGAFPCANGPMPLEESAVG